MRQLPGQGKISRKVMRGLGLGGDDYIVKTASPAEVVARVQAVLRRYRGGVMVPVAVLDFGWLVIDMQAREARVDGQPIALTVREFDVLAFLAAHPRQVITAAQLLDQFWCQVGDRHTVTVHIGRIREKIEPDPRQPRCLVTVWGVGYRFEELLKPLSMRQWLILSWLLCLGLPHAIFNLVEGIQHLVAPALRGPTWIIGPLSATLLTAGLTLLGVIWLIGQSVLKPLAAMQQAAHQIAAGDIDVHLPHSRVREVNEVAAAFTAMGAGLRESVLRQAAIEQERRVLMSAVAHDLRTPLFALRGYLEGLEQGVATTPTKIARYLAVCREQVAVLDQRIQALFEYARLEYLEQPLQRETVDWAAMTQQIIERLRPAAALKQVDLRVHCPVLACALDGDPHLLMRMMENLLDNAVRHTPPDSAVEVHWRVEAGRLCFSIADNGPGIAPADLPNLFMPMYRGDASRNRATGGAGLGLTIAQRIAQAHGGTLHAANRAQGGAEFTGWMANAWVHDPTGALSALEGRNVK